MEKVTKKRLKQVLTWAGMALVVAGLTVMPLMAKSEAEADGPQASILSVAPETASITTSLRGGGNLMDQDDQEVNIPTGVKITEFLVKNGDAVTEGTPLASVDKTSVMAAIVSVNNTMDYLQEQLEGGREEEVDETISAIPGGRVKKIFAKEGESVQEVMLRDGCLAVLSIDSMMAVQFETPSDLGTGEAVEVILTDGTATQGRVESNLAGIVVVTVDDEGYAIGQHVSVEGLGTGTLYIHNAWKATAHSGTISKIHTEEEKTLKAGAKLFTLGDRDFTGQLQHRANQHREYEQLLQTLLKMYQSGTIDAPCDGIVSGVDEDSAHLLSSQGQWEIKLLNNLGTGYRIVFLSSEEIDPQCTGEAGCPIQRLDGHQDTCPERCTKVDTCQAGMGRHYPECPKACIHATVRGTCNAIDHDATCIDACDEATTADEHCDASVHTENCIYRCKNAKSEGECPSKVHYSTCVEACKSCDVGQDCPGETHKKSCIERCARAKTESEVCDADKHYADCIKLCKSAQSAGEPCPAVYHYTSCYYFNVTYTATAAKVFSPGSDGLVVFQEARPTVYDVEKTASGWKITGAQLNTKLLVKNATVKTANAGQFQKDDIVLVVTGRKGEEVLPSQVVLYMRSLALPGGTDYSGLLNGRDYSSMFGSIDGMDLSDMMGGFAGYGNYGGAASGETESLHDLDGSTLLTVTPHKTMKLTITLDEQDIAKVSVGMTAKVKVEALKNQEFTARVTKVGISGTNSGGSSKFTVELLLDAAANMLPGMSATAQIDLETRENLLTLPVAAVSELHGKSVVYTSLDEKTGDPANPVEISTGVSDGERVEILSGISPETEVYYSYYDTLEEDTSAEASRFTFG